jgi:hypothetical protein
MLTRAIPKTGEQLPVIGLGHRADEALARHDRSHAGPQPRRN